MLTRGAALVILTATAPIAAAGLVSEVGQSWFWKSVRWTHAAALTPPLMALVIGVGTKLTTAVVTGTGSVLVRRDRHRRARGDAAPGLHVRTAGAVQAARVRRPRHQLRRRDAPGYRPRSAVCKASSAAPAPPAPVARPPPAPTAPAAPAGSPPARTPPAPASPSPPAGSSARSAVVLGGAGRQGRWAPRRAWPPPGRRSARTPVNQMGVGHNSYVPDFSTSRTEPRPVRQGERARGPRRQPRPGRRHPAQPHRRQPRTPGPGCRRPPDPARPAVAPPPVAPRGAAAAVPIVPV